MSSEKKMDLRLPIFLLILVIAAGMYAVTRRAEMAPETVLSPEERFAAAEAAHAEVVRPDGTIDVSKLAVALAEYEKAKSAADVRLSAKAHYGIGQLRVLAGDSNAAVGEWRNSVLLMPGDFEALRAMKSIADLERDSGRRGQAQVWYAMIVDTFKDTGLPQSMKLVVDAAREELKKR